MSKFFKVGVTVPLESELYIEVPDNFKVDDLYNKTEDLMDAALKTTDLDRGYFSDWNRLEDIEVYDIEETTEEEAKCFKYYNLNTGEAKLDRWKIGR